MVENHQDKTDESVKESAGEKEESKPNYVTQESVTALFKRLERLEKANKALVEQAAAKTSSEGVEDDAEAKPGKKSSRESELMQQLQAIQKERAAEKQQAKEQALRSSVTEQLISNGLDPRYVKHAVGYLVDSQKSVSYDEDGQLVMSVDRVPYELETAVKLFLKSEDAKPYLPPRGAAGSGSTNVKSSARNQTSESDAMEAFRNGIVRDIMSKS